MKLTLAGLKALSAPKKRATITRTPFADIPGHGSVRPVSVCEADLDLVEDKLHEVTVLLHQARLKVRKLLQKEKEAGRDKSTQNQKSP
jgi:hypothetical protein